MFFSTTLVNIIIGILKDKDNFLIAQRKQGSHQEHKWEFPGGKLEPNETDADTLQREFLEELGIHIQVKGFICQLTYKYPAMNVNVKAYYIDSNEKEKISMNVHEDIKWVSRDELETYDLVGADIEIVKKFL